MDNPSHRHIPELDAARGLAILLVTLYRFRPEIPDATTIGHAVFVMLGVGERGVDLFFVLSGVLITGILFDAKPKDHYFRDFYARRTLRIFPLYYGVLLVTLLAGPLLKPDSYTFAAAEQNQMWLWGYAANLLLAWQGTWCLGNFDHFWSLAVEEHFYLLWPVVIYFSSRRTALCISVTVAVASAGSRILWCVFGGNEVAADVFTLFRLDALLIGAWIALMARGPGGLRRLVPPARHVVWVTGLLLLLSEVVWQRRLLTVPTTLYGLFFGAIIVLAMTARPRSWTGCFWSSRVLRVLGKYSYGMYVFQNPLIPLLAMFFTAESLTQVLGSPLLGRLAYMALMFGATLSAAALSWHLYEQHFVRLKVRFGGDSNRTKVDSPPTDVGRSQAVELETPTDAMTLEVHEFDLVAK